MSSSSVCQAAMRRSRKSPVVMTEAQLDAYFLTRETLRRLMRPHTPGSPPQQTRPRTSKSTGR
jgi:hypothetical protein